MKNAHQQLISEIWKYRTRAEKYQTVLAEPMAAEIELKKTILDIKQQIVDKSTIIDVN